MSLPASFQEHWDITERLQTGGLRIHIRGRNNAQSSEMIKHIYHLISQKFSQFQALFGHFMYKIM